MVLPVVVMILGVTLASLTLQLERMKMVSVAATLSRAMARGEPPDKVLELLGNRSLTWKNTGELVCAEVSASFTLPGLPGFPLLVSDQECARRLGL